MLPKPNVKMAVAGQEQLSEADIKGMLCNPIYAGIGPFPKLVPDEQWVTCAAKIIKEEGAEQFLVNLLFLLRESHKCLE